jgi:hypothetical protein
MTTKTSVNPAEVLDQAAQTYFGAVRTGLKLQEDIATRWVNLFTKADSGEYLPLAFQQAVNEAVPLVQKQTEDALKLIEKGTRQSLDLLAQAFETGQAESPAKAQARLEELWEASLTTLRDNARAMVQANGRLMESWASLARKNVERVTTAAGKAGGKA